VLIIAVTQLFAFCAHPAVRLIVVGLERPAVASVRPQEDRPMMEAPPQMSDAAARGGRVIIGTPQALRWCTV
jgi:hypothetical protein